MDKRTRAMEILKQAQELLSERLVEDIVESGDGILGDAEGRSYMNEIETLQEKVGGRLNHINGMIANLPAGKPASEEVVAGSQDAPVATAAAQAPGIQPARNFALFGRQIADNDIDGAAATLAELLDVDPKLAQHCATAFRDRFNEDPTIVQKAMQLRTTLAAGANNDSLMILWDCFRLQGPQAVEVLQTLKTQLAAM